MAYQVRQRDPLLDSNMQAAIERRGKELLGIALLITGVLCGMMLASYSPEDPSWLSATDATVQNWLGRFGAALASPLFVLVGAGHIVGEDGMIGLLEKAGCKVEQIKAK